MDAPPHWGLRSLCCSPGLHTGCSWRLQSKLLLWITNLELSQDSNVKIRRGRTCFCIIEFIGIHGITENYIFYNVICKWTHRGFSSMNQSGMKMKALWELWGKGRVTAEDTIWRTIQGYILDWKIHVEERPMEREKIQGYTLAFRFTLPCFFLHNISAESLS